jgi:hypothetical protein
MDDHGRALYPVKFDPSGLVEFGVLRPTFTAYSAIFYRLFNDWVIGFYIFKLLLTAITLVVWGFLAYRITGERISFWLVSAVTLSFHYFYDSIFYLSSQEILGLFFLGIALHFFLSGIIWKEKKPTIGIAWLLEFLGLLCLVLAFFSKEPFVATGVAVGIGYIFLVARQLLRSREKKINWKELITAILLIGISLGYGLFLMISIRRGYSSGYDPFNTVKMFNSLYGWARKDFVNHVPWILGTIWILYNCPKFSGDQGRRFSWGLVTGIFIYCGYLLILLPWSTNSYYATPFGLFFGFCVALVVASRCKRLSRARQGIVIIISLTMNIVVCLYALHRESIYQYDTSNLLQWARISVDDEKYDLSSVAINAAEPAVGIPHLLQMKWNISVPQFEYVSAPNPDRHKLFLYSPRFGALRDCDIWNLYPTLLSRVGLSEGKAVCYGLDKYRVLLVSSNWIVFALKEDV